MPNWCMNEGSVMLPENASDDAKEAFAKLREGGEKWFAKVFPTPSELSLGLGSTQENQEYLNMAWLRANSQFKGTFGKIKKHPGSRQVKERLEFVPTKKYQQYLKDTFGSDNWYSWNVENWGTKWDVTPNIWGEDDKSFNFSFDSAWGPPEAFFEHLADQYGIEYSIKYYEPGAGFAGKRSYLDGKHNHTSAEGNDYHLFVIQEFDEPIESAIYALQDHSSYEEFIAAEPSYADSPALLRLIKEHYGYEDPPVKKKTARKTTVKKTSKKASKKKT
jgi:Ferredoxin-like domain in Api92-like protein